MITEKGERISKKEALVRMAIDCGFQRFEAEGLYYCLCRFKDRIEKEKEKNEPTIRQNNNDRLRDSVV